MSFLNRFMTICAIAGGMTLVGVTSGFTKAPNGQLDPPLRFQYVVPQNVSNPYSQTNVETLTNWEYAASDPGCSIGNTKPCTIKVSEDYVQGSTPSSYTLDPSFVITASNDSIAHVTGTSDGTTSDYFTNRGLL